MTKFFKNFGYQIHVLLIQKLQAFTKVHLGINDNNLFCLEIKTLIKNKVLRKRNIIF